LVNVGAAITIVLPPTYIPKNFRAGRLGSGVREGYDAAMSDPDSMPDDAVSTPGEADAPEVANAGVVSAAEQAFSEAVAAAEAVRQQAKAAAFTAYGWNSVNQVAYQRALADADVAYSAAVKAAGAAAELGVLTPPP
jgi:hypothetical protein